MERVTSSCSQDEELVDLKVIIRHKRAVITQLVSTGVIGIPPQATDIYVHGRRGSPDYSITPHKDFVEVVITRPVEDDQLYLEYSLEDLAWDYHYHHYYYKGKYTCYLMAKIESPIDMPLKWKKNGVILEDDHFNTYPVGDIRRGLNQVKIREIKGSARLERLISHPLITSEGNINTNLNTELDSDLILSITHDQSRFYRCNSDIIYEGVMCEDATFTYGDGKVEILFPNPLPETYRVTHCNTRDEETISIVNTRGDMGLENTKFHFNGFNPDTHSISVISDYDKIECVSVKSFTGKIYHFVGGHDKVGYLTFTFKPLKSEFVSVVPWFTDA